MPSLFIIVPPIGIGKADGFTYNALRPARHCGICGDSFQPWLARTPEYDYDEDVRMAVDIEIKEWANAHNASHSEAQHIKHIESGNLMTPEAAIRLIPLGIYPIQDMVLDEEVAQAGLEAPACPVNDVPDR